MIEFYGEISEYTKRRAEKLKKRYFAKWIGVLAIISGAVAALSGATRSGFIVPLVCAVLLLAGHYLRILFSSWDETIISTLVIARKITATQV